MRIFLTGIGGFSGSWLAKYFVSRGHDVIGLSRSGTCPLEMPKNAGRFLILSQDLAALNELPTGIDAVVHAAATSPVDGTPIDCLITDNVLATQNLVRLSQSAGVRKFVFFSSTSVYGDVSTERLDEKTSVTNPSAYGLSKLLGEICLRERADCMSSLVMRLPAVLGRGAARHWLAKMMERAQAGTPLDIYNPEAPFNNAVHISDLCSFVETWLERDAEGYDVVTLAAEGHMPIGGIIARVMEATASKSRVIVHALDRRSFTISSRHARETYGYRPRDFENMLECYLGESLDGSARQAPLAERVI